MDKQTILYISPSFPPLNSSASIANAYYCQELSRLGYRVIVLTAEIPSDHISFQTNFRCTEVDVTVRRTDIGLYKRFYTRKITGGNTNKTNNAGFSPYLKKIIKDFICIPDVFTFWASKSMKMAIQIMEEFAPLIVITRSEPNSVHLLGAKLKKAYPQLQWIGYFGDPWSLEPSLNKTNRLIQHQLEKKVIHQMDRYVFTTDATRDLYSQKFGIPIQLTSVFSRGYDPEIYKLASTVKLEAKKIKFVYSGAIGRQRDISHFMSSVEEMKAQLEEKALFYFVGSYTASIREKFAKYTFIRLPGFVTFEESIMYEKEADFLILLDNKDGIQLPAKAFEYIGTNNPIITFITNDETPLSKLMRQVGRGPISHNDKDSISGTLSKAIELYENKGIAKQWRSVNTEFEISSVVKQFALVNF